MFSVGDDEAGDSPAGGPRKRFRLGNIWSGGHTSAPADLVSIVDEGRYICVRK